MAKSVLPSLLAVLIFCTTLFGMYEARPHRRGPTPSTIARSASILGPYSVPLFNGTASLPAPPSSDSLKAITIGRGTQNYTCATSTSSSTPVSIGAVADLFDASVLLPFLSPKDGEEILDLLPAYLVTFPYEALANSTLPSLGQHYFEGPTSPVFNLEEGKIGMLNGAKAADIIAPPSSSPGPDGKGNGAVDWLMLTALAGSQNLNTAYRVHTAGGKAPKTCEGQRAVIEVEYAAQYWFYG